MILRHIKSDFLQGLTRKKIESLYSRIILNIIKVLWHIKSDHNKKELYYMAYHQICASNSTKWHIDGVSLVTIVWHNKSS